MQIFMPCYVKTFLYTKLIVGVKSHPKKERPNLHNAQSISFRQFLSIKGVAGIGHANLNDFTYANAFPVLGKGLDVLKLTTSARNGTNASKFPRTSFE
jgi:hypothetical protein